jgi:hypothetical protein
MRKLMVLALAFVMGCSFGTVLALDPSNPGDAARDGDRDGLTNLEEFIHGTDPYNTDSDFDSLPDGWEVYYDEHRAAWFPGGPNYDRCARYDSDGDGVCDVNVDPSYKYSPVNKADAADTPDDDLWDNLQEYISGTDPTNPDTDTDGWRDDMDPEPLIPNGVPGLGSEWGNIGPNPGPSPEPNPWPGPDPDHHTSGQEQGFGLGTVFAHSWEIYTVRGL